MITFTGGDYFYGHRLGLEMLVCSAPAFCFSAARAGRVARALLAPVLAVQLFAMAVGAMGATLFVEERLVWTRNAFVDTMLDAGASAWVALVLVALVGVLVGRATASTGREDPRQDEVPLGPVQSRVDVGAAADVG